MKKKQIFITAAVLIFAGLSLWFIWRKSILPVDRYIRYEKQKIREKEFPKFKEYTIGNIDDKVPYARQYTNSSDATSIAFFENHYFIGTTGGLLKYDKNFVLISFYTNLNGLAENYITALKIFKNELYIGFKTKGLMKLNKGYLTAYQFYNTNEKNIKNSSISISNINITCLYTLDEHLYIGTFGSGIISFDGHKFSTELNLKKGSEFHNVTTIGNINDRLVVGTYSDGVYVEQLHGFIHLTEKENLPDNHITNIKNIGEEFLIITPVGVVKMSKDLKFESKYRASIMTDIVAYRDAHYFGTFDRGIITDETKGSIELPGKFKLNKFEVVENLWALTNQGVYILQDSSWKKLESTTLLKQTTGFSPGINQSKLLPGNHITSLAMDNQRNLWIGTFEDGIAILDENGKIQKFIKDEICREINHITTNYSEASVWVGTNQGLLIFNDKMERKHLAQQDGLISSAVTHITINDARNSARKIISTAAGITVLDGKEARSYYVFNGLINNHVYTSVFHNEKVYLGTLGGISILEKDRITGDITTTNSALQHNWITALTAVDKKLFIGTYGGGIDYLDEKGKIIGLQKEIGKFEVNFNAMFFDSPYLFVGTLQDGLKIFDTKQKRWYNPDYNFGSSNITSVFGSANRLYIGTEAGLTVLDDKYRLLRVKK